VYVVSDDVLVHMRAPLTPSHAPFSGIRLQAAVVDDFEGAILAGDWDAGRRMLSRYDGACVECFVECFVACLFVRVRRR